MTKFLNPRCAKCGHYQKGICLLDNQPSKDTSLCRYYTESPYICELCGKHLIQEVVNYTFGTNPHIVCNNCFQQIYTCQACEYGNVCKFEQDQTVPEPTYVTQQIRQGPAIIQQQVKNPKRINLTCRVNCPCFINEQCCKENGSCDKYQCSVENW
jgi:hypothetical protein